MCWAYSMSALGLLSPIIAAVVTVLSTLATIRIERSKGILCMDIHKPSKPLVPCIGGFGILAGALAGLALYAASDLVRSLGLAISLSAAFAIGLLDDFRGLSAYRKIALGLVPALPIVLLGLYVPRPWLPFMGYARMTIIYPLLVFAAFTVFINGANMVDTHNGLLVSAALLAHLGALVVKIASGASLRDIALLALFTAVLAAYLPFNAYPAKTLNGNAGSFIIGCMIAVSTVVTRLEAYFILACLPLFINGFYYLSSVRGFLQKERVERPVEIDEHGCMRAKASPQAPITLVRLVLALSRSALSEAELVTVLIAIYAITSLLAAVTIIVLGYGSP